MTRPDEARWSVLADGLLVDADAEGERLLAVAVLADALQLLTEGPDHTPEYRQDWFWAFDTRRDYEDPHIYAFHSICALVHLDHVAVRERVWRMIKRKFPRGPLISLPETPAVRGHYVSRMDQRIARRRPNPRTRISRRQVTGLVPCDLSVLGFLITGG